ncbi:protein O-mannosyl-transferase 2-like [Palaemon carinicauda]|uniref:protein O-mannosyl-transferase 2-like n=1 Tax=Palaemon carinicauda TaxID=392227 RepID=UPI0035B58EC4
MSDSEDSLKGDPVPEGKVENLKGASDFKSIPWSTKVVKLMDDFRAGDKGKIWWAVFWLFVTLSVASRLHYISEPYKVVWDEAHFGKMVSWYINRTFFFDVHPVGGKLLLTLFGYLGGYNGTHSFHEPSYTYDGYEGIMSMRIGCALLGAGLVPFAFHIVWTLTRSLPASAFAAALITFEIGTITLSKFILLDPLLMFFIMGSFHGLCLMHEVEDRPFSRGWWNTYVYTGVMLGCVLSVKFVGLFIVLVVGCYTALDLWQKLGELNRPLVSVLVHFLARVFCLIIIPVAVYLTIFFIHDQILIKARTNFAGDEGIFSPGFQMRLEDNGLYNMTQPDDVAFGSVVTMKNANLGGVYLHSHNISYPPALVGKDRLQVTGFSAKDQNNLFRILFPEDDPDLPDSFYRGLPELVMNGDWVRLYHLQSESLLSCAKNKSLITRKHNLMYGMPYNLTDPEESAKMVSQYENNEEARPRNEKLTAWQLFQVVIDGGKPGEKLRVLDSRVKFVCVPLNCAIFWARAKLPNAWGFGQHEISCGGNLMDPYTDWIIEQQINPYLPNKTFERFETTFFSRFLETHRVMRWVNSRLKPEGADLFNSHRPWMWPICVKSQVWFDVQFRIVLLGNPIIFWINLIFLFAGPAILVFHHYKQKRGHEDSLEVKERKDRMIFACKWLLLAYLFHYLPFYTMNRILYYHHYFPALQFSSMLTAVVFGYILETLETWLPTRRANLAFHWATTVFFAVLVYSFYLYCYVGYGHPTDGPFNLDNSTYKNVRLFDDWEI